MSSTIEAAINEVLYGECGECMESFIPCRDKTQQESVRIMSYAVKNKLDSVANRELIGITKVEEDGKLFVKIYKKLQEEIWVRDKDTGKLVPKRTLLLNVENERAIAVIRKSGYGDDAVIGYLESVKNNLPFELDGYQKVSRVDSPELSIVQVKDATVDRKAEKAAMLEMISNEM